MKATTAVILPSAQMRHIEGGRRVITLYIPRPHRSLAQNARGHWAIALPHKKAQKDACLLAVASLPKVTFDWVRITFRYVNGKRVKGEYEPADHQNAGGALKAAIDGIVESGLIQDDNKKVVLFFGGEIVTEKGGQGRVEIDIEEVWL